MFHFAAPGIRRTRGGLFFVRLGPYGQQRRLKAGVALAQVKPKTIHVFHVFTLLAARLFTDPFGQTFPRDQLSAAHL